MSGEGWECNYGHQHDWDEACPNEIVKLAPSAPEAPTAEAARVRSPQQEEFNGYDVGADLEGWVHHDMDCAWGTGPGCACSCGLSEALAKIDAELSSLRLQAGLDDVVSAGSPSDLARITELELEITTLRSTHATLQSALRMYARHLPGCPKVSSMAWARGQPCDCKFEEMRAALNGAPGTE